MKFTRSLIAFSFLASLSVHADEAVPPIDDLIAKEESWKIFTPGVAEIEIEETQAEPQRPVKKIEVTQAQGDMSPQVEVLDENSPPEPQPVPMQQPQPAKKKKKSPEKKMVKKGGTGVYIVGDWLLWTVQQGGMEYATTKNNIQGVDLNGAHAQKISFDWESGFRVGVGSHFGPDLWDVYFGYTHFHPEASDSVFHDGVYPLLSYQGASDIKTLSGAQARWQIQLNEFDLILGREYFMTKQISLRPNIGLKGADIHQVAAIQYSDITGMEIPLGEEFHVKQHSEFKGIGLNAGVDSCWYFGKGFNIFGNAAAALLYGKFDMKQVQTQFEVEQIDLKSTLHQFSPMAQLVLGVAWDGQYYNKTLHVGISAGYEIQYWWRQNQFERFTSFYPSYIRSSEDLTFHGLTLSFRLDF